MDMFGESIEGYKHKTPYQVVEMLKPHLKEDMELLQKILNDKRFDVNCTPFVRQYDILKTRGVIFMPKGVANKRYTPEFKDSVKVLSQKQI